MNPKSMTRLIVVALIAAMLGGAYVIVEKSGSNAQSGKQEAPSGFFH